MVKPHSEATITRALEVDVLKRPSPHVQAHS